MGFFSGKKVFITGGSSGIGKACAELALQLGAHVVIAGRRTALLEEARAELAKHAGENQVLAIQPLDVADEAAVFAAAPKVVELLGGLDVLINNAGVAHVGYLKDETTQNYRDMININYLGSVYVTQAFLPHFMAQRSGHIGFTSSVLGQMGLFGYSAYCGSKFAMTGYADCLRMDLLQHNITVHVCFPPDTDTPQHTQELLSMPPETKAVAGTIKMMPPKDVASEFLAGIASNTYQITPSLNNKVTMWAVQHFPSIARFCIDSDIRKVAKAKETAVPSSSNQKEAPESS